MKKYIIISLFLLCTQRDNIYMCHDDPFIDEQCMKKEKIGENTFIWLRKCKGSKVCVNLPYYGEITGSCIIKVRSHYDGESCANGNKCTSGNCDGTKCIGKDQGIQCEPGLGQCKKGLLCRKTDTASSLTTCQEPIQPGKACGKYAGDSTFSGDYIFDDDEYLDPGSNVCTLGYTCDYPEVSSGICVRIGSIKADKPSGNPLACETGLLNYEGNKCVSKYDEVVTDPDGSDNVEKYTSKGLEFTNYANATRHFNSWLDASTYDDDTEDEDAIYEAYRYTRNKKKINECIYL